MRTRQARSTTRNGQMHLCGTCVADAGGYHTSETDPRVKKQLTFMLEVPPESDTSARLGGRSRTWFCRSCIEAIFETDPPFAERNRHLELVNPRWWDDPATDTQVGYLIGLMEQRNLSQDIRREIDAGVDTATKGQMCRWLSTLEVSPWTTPYKPESEPEPKPEKVLQFGGPREVVH